MPFEIDLLQNEKKKMPPEIDLLLLVLLYITTSYSYN
jgi:hypothetical protein